MRAYSLWQQGNLTVSVAANPLWQVREALLAGREGLRIRETRPARRDQVVLEASWADGRAQVRALLVVDEFETARLRWRLLARSDRAWTTNSSSPVARLALPELGACTDPAGVPLLNGAESHHGSHGADTAAWATQISSRLRHPERSTALVVVTVEAVADAVNDPAAMSLQFGYPGLLSCVIVDENARVALQQHCPETPVSPGGARLFPAPCDDIREETIVGAGQFTKSRLHSMVRTVVSARENCPLPAWSGEEGLLDGFDQDRGRAGTVELPPRGRLERPAATPDADAAERERRLVADNDRLRAKLAQAQETISTLRRELEAARGLAGAPVLVAGGQHHRQLATAPEPEPRLRQEGGGSSAFRTAAGAPAAGQDGSGDPPAFATFEALFETAGRQLRRLVITADLDGAAALDSHPEAPRWRLEAWRALLTLQAYAETKAIVYAQGGRPGPDLRNLLLFVKARHEGALIPDSCITLREPPALARHPDHARHRTYPVPKNVDPAGWAYFPAHIRLGSSDRALRLQFLDDTSQTGKVFIGYRGLDRIGRTTT